MSSYYTKDQVLGLKPINELPEDIFLYLTTRLKLLITSTTIINQKVSDIKDLIERYTNKIFESIPRNYFYPDTMDTHSGVTLAVKVEENKKNFKQTIKDLLIFIALKIALSIGKPAKIVNNEAVTTINNISVLLDFLRNTITKEKESKS